jgi:hypothetical protein
MNIEIMINFPKKINAVQSISRLCVSVSIMFSMQGFAADNEIDQINARLTHSGGISTQLGMCPSSAMDTIVPVDSLNPTHNANQLVMTIDGVNEFIRKNNITTIEKTRATGQSNLTYPRIILFGSDGRFLLNIGSKADDPKYHLLDVAEMHEDTGKWEFSVFDFTGDRPKLTRNDPTCSECHGAKNARPFWGTVLGWCFWR